MKIYQTFKNWRVKRRLALLAALGAAISTLLIAVPASAETTSGMTSAAPSTGAESSAPVEEASSAPIEQSQTPSGETSPQPPVAAAEETSPEPAEAHKVTSVASSVTTPVENGPAASPASPSQSVPAPPAIDTTVSSPVTADRVPIAAVEVPAEVGVPAAKPDVPLLHSSKSPVPGLLDQVDQGAAQTIATVVNQPAVGLATVVDQPAVGILPPLGIGVLPDSVTLGATEALLQAIEPLPAPTGGTPAGRVLELPESTRAGLFSHRGSIIPLGERARETLFALGGVETVGFQVLDHPDDRRKTLPPTMDGSGGGLAKANVNRFGSPGPLKGPPPAPQAPGAVASGFGGSLFVLLAALFALLALLAPAIFRRLWEVSAYPPPTPFVCGLERPG